MPAAANPCLPPPALPPAIDLELRVPLKPWLGAHVRPAALNPAASDHSHGAASSLNPLVRVGARHHALVLDLFGAGRGAFIARRLGERRYASAALQASLRLGTLRPVRFRRDKILVSGRYQQPLASQKPRASDMAGVGPRPQLAAQVTARGQRKAHAA